jgi:hypothetical protein
MCAGGVAVDVGVGAARAAGAVADRDRRAAEVISRDRRPVFFGAGTSGNVPFAGCDVP